MLASTRLHACTYKRICLRALPRALFLSNVTAANFGAMESTFLPHGGPPLSLQRKPFSLPRSRHCHRGWWYATIAWQLSLQLPWRHGAAAEALKASCINSWCVDTFCASSILCEAGAFSAQSCLEKVRILCSAVSRTLGDLISVSREVQYCNCCIYLQYKATFH